VAVRDRGPITATIEEGESEPVQLPLQERWVGLLATEEDLQHLPEASDVRMKAEEFQNYAQQMENAVLSLAISVEEVRSLVRQGVMTPHPRS